MGAGVTSGNMEPVEMMTFMEAAKALRISRNTAYRMAEEGTFPVPIIRMRRVWRVSAKALKEFIETGSTGDGK